MSRHKVGREFPMDTWPLHRVVAELRAPVRVRPEWRAGVLRGIALLPSPDEQATPVRHWRLRPISALAAGLVCMLVGAGATALLLAPRKALSPNDALTSLTATMPLPGEQAARPPVRFVFVAPYAARVALVGDFNAWNPSATPMRRSSDGRAWLIDVALAPGRHVYSFIVDGDLAPDPSAPRSGDDDFGVPSSVVVVGARGPRT